MIVVAFVVGQIVDRVDGADRIACNLIHSPVNGSNTGNTVGNGAPVGHNIALKAPFVPENLCQKPGILGGIDTVDPVVGTHDGPGLGLLHGDFKGGEVDFPEGPLGQAAVGLVAVVLAVVAGIVKTNNTVYPEKRDDGYCARVETHLEEVKVIGLINMDVVCQGAIMVGTLPEPITTTKDPMTKVQ